MQDATERCQQIDLMTPLRLKRAFLFPMQSALARREVLVGALWLLAPVIGWILNMGHRIMMTHRMQHGLSAWPAWRNYRGLFRHGGIALLGMVEYHLPAAVCAVVAWRYEMAWLAIVASVLWCLATLAVPGYMSHYCYSFDAREVFNPLRALRRAVQGGRGYWHAWLIALAALLCSFGGVIAFGIGFLVTSVWFWQVAGFAFASAFSQTYGLKHDSAPGAEEWLAWKRGNR